MKTVSFNSGLLLISHEQDTTQSMYFISSLHVNKTNDQTLEVVHQGKSIFVMSSNPSSPYAGNNVNGATDIATAYNDLKNVFASI
jgi:hypothetical protein